MIKVMVVLSLFILVSGCVQQENYANDFNNSIDVQKETVRSPVEITSANKSGTILIDEVWSGTIHVTGDIHVPHGVTLTIVPGTVVQVQANYDDTGIGGEHIIDEATNIDPSATSEYTKSHISFNIRGTLIAVGRSEKKIIFTSDADSPYNTDWDGMTFESTSSGELKYCIIEWVHTGPALHGTDDVKISHSEIRHTFWGGLHAFQNSPVFEYNVLDDIGHEAFDTHKASPIIRFNNISHTRTALVFNYYDINTGDPLVFENNIIRDSSNLAQLQENSKAIIRNNEFIGSNDTGGPWHYKGFTLSSGTHSEGIHLADNVDVEIIGNSFTNFEWSAINYERIGPNQGIGHTTNLPEPFEIGDNPVKILIKDNHFDNSLDEEWLNELEETWQNVEVVNNNFG